VKVIRLCDRSFRKRSLRIVLVVVFFAFLAGDAAAQFKVKTVAPFLKSQSFYRERESSDSIIFPHRTEFDTMLSAVPLEFLAGAGLYTIVYFLSGANHDYGINDSREYVFPLIAVAYLPAAEALLITTIGKALTKHPASGLGTYAAAYVGYLAGAILTVGIAGDRGLSPAGFYCGILASEVVPSILYYIFVHKPAE